MLTQFVSRVEAQADADRAEARSHIDGIMAILVDWALTLQPLVEHVGVSRDAPHPELIPPPGSMMSLSMGIPPILMATLAGSLSLPSNPLGMPSYSNPMRTSQVTPSFPSFSNYPSASGYPYYIPYTNNQDYQNMEPLSQYAPTMDPSPTNPQNTVHFTPPP